MQEVTNFAFEEHLVRTVMIGDEPWFVGRDVCNVLGLRDHKQALERLDDDERGRYSIPTPGGEQSMVVVSEAGVFRLIFASRKPEAERFKRWLAHDVLPTLRKTGKFEIATQPEETLQLAEQPLAIVQAKLQMVREYRILRGPAAALRLWRALGLPQHPTLEDPVDDEPAECLRLLMTEAVDGRPGMILDLLLAALGDDMEAEQILKGIGLRTVMTGAPPDTFWVANRSIGLSRIYAGSAWANGRWAMALARLPGVVSGGHAKVSGDASYGKFVPTRYIDLGLLNGAAGVQA